MRVQGHIETFITQVKRPSGAALPAYMKEAPDTWLITRYPMYRLNEELFDARERYVEPGN